MNTKEISKLFTAKANELLNNGYRIHLESMRGYGECGSDDEGRYSVWQYIDFTNGKRLIKLAVIGRSFHTKDYKYYSTMNVEVFEAPSSRIGKNDGLWMSELELLERTEFYEIANHWYGTKEQANARRAKHDERISKAVPRRESDIKEFEPNSNVKRLALSFVKRQRGYKTTTLENIAKVYKTIKRDRYGKILRADYVVEVVRNGKRSALTMGVTR